MLIKMLLAWIGSMSRGPPLSPLLAVPPPDACSIDSYRLLNYDSNPEGHLLLVASPLESPRHLSHLTRPRPSWRQAGAIATIQATAPADPEDRKTRGSV